jgi:hypothetical protein
MATKKKAPKQLETPPIPKLTDNPEYVEALDKLSALQRRERTQSEKVADLHQRLAAATTVDPDAGTLALLDDPEGPIEPPNPSPSPQLTEALGQLETIRRAVKKAQAFKEEAASHAGHRLVDEQIKDHNAKLSRRAALAFVELETTLRECRDYRQSLRVAGLIISHLPAPLRPAWMNFNANQLHNKATGFLRDMVANGFLSVEEATAHLTNPQPISSIRSAAK